MKVVVLTFGDRSAGSTKYRIVQYESYLRTQGIELEFVQRADMTQKVVEKIAQADVLLNQKCLLSLNLARRIARAASRIVFDFDDAIYTRPGRPYHFLTRRRVLNRFHFWLRRADVVFPANGFLANYARSRSRNIQTIPMALDFDDWKPSLQARRSPTVNIGWAGAPANLPHLETLSSPLKRILERYHPHVKLRVFCGRRPALTCPFDYVPFEDGAEPDFVRSLDIGLLPLNGDEFSNGKSPIKAIQYLGCEVPVVGHIAGATREILNENNSIAVDDVRDWEPALRRLIEDPSLRARLGRAGRQHVLQNHDSRVVRKQIVTAIQTIAS